MDRGSDSRTGILGVDELKGFFFFFRSGERLVRKREGRPEL